jgi:hypothetical protein
MTVTFTLTTSSTDAGPFNISGTTSGGALNDVSIATGISKATLLTGHPISNISETITGGTIASTGTCTNTIPWSVISATPTPTPTQTSQTYYCRENEFSPCIAQVSPCIGNQIICTEFEQPN